MNQRIWIISSVAAVLGWLSSPVRAVECDVLCACSATMQTGGCTLPTGSGLTSAGISFYHGLSSPGCCDYAPWGCVSQKCHAEGRAYITQSAGNSRDLTITFPPNGYSSGNGIRQSLLVVHDGECGTSTTVSFASNIPGPNPPVVFCQLWIGCGDC